MRHIATTIIASAILMSCSGKQERPNSNNIEEKTVQKEYIRRIPKESSRTKYDTLDIKNIVACKALTLKPIKLPQEYDQHSRSLVYNDTILIQMHEKDKFERLVTLWNMNSMDTIGSFVRAGYRQCISKLQGSLFTSKQGQLPNSINGQISGEHLLLFERRYQYALPLNLSKALKAEKGADTTLLYPPMYTTAIYALLDDSRAIFYDQTFLDRNGFHTNDSVDEFAITDLNGVPEKESITSNTVYNVGNVSGALIASNPKRKRFMTGYVHSPVYKLYDSNLNVLKVINGPDKDDDVLAEMTDSLTNFIDFVDAESIYNISYTATDKHIVFQNARIHKHKLGVPMQPFGKNTAEFFIFDWNGNLVARYHCKGKVITNFSLSEESQTLYLNSLETNGTRKLYKAKVEL